MHGFEWIRPDARSGCYGKDLSGMTLGNEGDMVQAHGLYFPYINIRDDNWLKTAALYWPTVRRLVPRHHETHDTRTARAFAEANVLRSEDPGSLLASVGFDLLIALRGNVGELASRYRVDAATPGLFDASGLDHLGWVHLEKFPPGAVDLLVEHGLAIRGRREPIWSQTAHRHGAPGNWIGLHPAVAGAYMTALASHLSERAGFQPITDQADLRAAVPNRDVEAALQLLVGPGPRLAHRETIDRYVMLAVQSVAPRNLSAVSPDVILRCREALAAELETFREHVAEQADELVSIASVAVDQRRLEAFSEHAQRQIERPLRDLERGLALHRLPTVRTMLTASSFAAPAVVTTVVGGWDQPVVAKAAETVAAIGVAWWLGVRPDRARLRAASPVGYLLGVRERLTPTTFANSVGKFFAGTYG